MVNLNIPSNHLEISLIFGKPILNTEQGSLTNLNNQYVHYAALHRTRNNRSDLGNKQIL